MPIENRALTAGTTLVATYKKQAYVCEVIDEGGETRFRLKGEENLHKSPSSAASAVMGGIAANGWKFWSVEGEELPAKEGAAPTTRGKKKSAKDGGLKRFIAKTPNQRGVPEGKAKWFCTSCVKSFIAPAMPEPEACPEGHPTWEKDEVLMA